MRSTQSELYVNQTVQQVITQRTKKTTNDPHIQTDIVHKLYRTEYSQCFAVCYSGAIIKVQYGKVQK